MNGLYIKEKLVIERSVFKIELKVLVFHAGALPHRSRVYIFFSLATVKSTKQDLNKTNLNIIKYSF